jgi:hypothetical protein
MKTEKILNKNILQLTMMIENEYPELSKYIDELWVGQTDSAQADLKINNLLEYYNSLKALYNSYHYSKVDSMSKMTIAGDTHLKYKTTKENEMLLIMENSLANNKGELIHFDRSYNI